MPECLPPTSLPEFPSAALEDLLPLAFREDEGSGDVTSLATISEAARGVALLLCKQAGVVAGMPLAEKIFRFRGLEVNIRAKVSEGAQVQAGTVLMEMEGPLRGLLICERTLLNFMQRLSGIATVTRAFMEALAGSRTQLLDTRKTLPGFRHLDKYAVAVGGGVNHRMGLYDRVLVKDNHAEAAGSVRAAVDRIDSEYHGRYLVEAEVRSMKELQTLLDAKVDVILLDNMDDETLRRAIALTRARAPSIKLEASGNMDLQRLVRLRDFGLDFISVGALTHSVKALDISMDIKGAAHGG